MLAPVRATTARTVRSPLNDTRARQRKAPLAEVVSAWPSSRSRLAASRSVTVTSVLAGRPLPLTVTPEQSTLRIPRYISSAAAAEGIAESRPSAPATSR